MTVLSSSPVNDGPQNRTSIITGMSLSEPVTPSLTDAAMGDYPSHEQQTVHMGNSFDSATWEILSVSNNDSLDQGDQSLASVLAVGTEEASSERVAVDTFGHGTGNDLTPTTADTASSPAERYHQTSQLILLSTTMDWLAVSETPTSSSFSYFVDVVDCPLLSPFDALNYTRLKRHIACMGLQQTTVAKALLAVQALYRAQMERLSTTHAMSVYQTAVHNFDAMLGDETTMTEFDILLIVAFLLCLCVVTLPNEDEPWYGVLNSLFIRRLELWLSKESDSAHEKSPVSLRICAWLQLLNTVTKRPGCVGLLPEPVFDLLYLHMKEVPNLSHLDRDAHPEHSLYDTVAAPVFTFHLALQAMSNRVVNVTHYRRSRTTPADQAEVTERMAALMIELLALWDNRPPALRLPPAKLREHFSAQISTPLIALARVVTAAYHAETVIIGRILGDPPFPTPEARYALQQIREVVDADLHDTENHNYNISSTSPSHSPPTDPALSETLNPGFLRPIFAYALESFSSDGSRGGTVWAAQRLRQIQLASPLSRAGFLASFVEAHGEAQRAQGRRVTMKYFCYQTYGVPLPFM